MSKVYMKKTSNNKELVTVATNNKCLLAQGDAGADKA